MSPSPQPFSVAIRHRRGLLGQAAPGAASDTDLYTVPDLYTATVRLFVANRGAATTYRIALRSDGDALANQHYIAFDEPLDANEVAVYTVELDETDVVTVRAGSANVSFVANGVEEPKA